MKKALLPASVFFVALLFFTAAFRPAPNNAVKGYAIGDKAEDFNLRNVDGKTVSLASYPSAKGFVIVFTCNHCPVAREYEDRIIELSKTVKAKGFQLIAIQPNNPEENPEDGFSEMRQRAKEKAYTFPYLLDEGQKVYPRFGATRTPHVFILDQNRVVGYIGGVDDNSDAGAVKRKYAEMAVDALLQGKRPEPSFTRAIGCGIH